jgi:tetratricopeptide (TPR) repeat protein
MSALHVQVSDRATAAEIHRQATEEEVPFAHLVAEYSENDQTRANDGDLGWFNRGGFIPGIRDSKGFTEAIWDLEMGVNPPLEFGGNWHVVKVADRKYERLQTLEEAYDRVVRDMLPEYRRTLLEQWLRTAREEADLEYFGEFRPGEGKTAEELFERAFHAKDTQNKLDLLGLLLDDYPRSEYADDALFMAGNLVLDAWGDRPQASRFFRRLLEDHPESDYAADARYILENLHRPGFVNPTSIEDLRRSGE